MSLLKRKACLDEYAANLDLFVPLSLYARNEQLVISSNFIILKLSKVTLKWRRNLPENTVSKDFPYQGSKGDLPQKFHVA